MPHLSLPHSRIDRETRGRFPKGAKRSKRKSDKEKEKGDIDKSQFFSAEGGKRVTSLTSRTPVKKKRKR